MAKLTLDICETIVNHSAWKTQHAVCANSTTTADHLMRRALTDLERKVSDGVSPKWAR